MANQQRGTLLIKYKKFLIRKRVHTSKLCFALSFMASMGYGHAYNPFLAERTIPRSSAPGFVHSGTLPSYLADNIDGIRNIGNFAAHPLKSTASGEIVEVEPGEAEYCIAKSKRAALDAKLKDLAK